MTNLKTAGTNPLLLCLYRLPLACLLRRGFQSALRACQGWDWHQLRRAVTNHMLVFAGTIKTAAFYHQNPVINTHTVLYMCHYPT